MRGLIFGATKRRAEQRMEKLIRDYKDFWKIKPEKIRKNSNEYSVVFENGDYWQACVMHDGCRGRRANVVLIDEKIKCEYDAIAHHCATAQPYSAIRYF